jgi:hypothetical protein
MFGISQPGIRDEGGNSDQVGTMIELILSVRFDQLKDFLFLTQGD